MHVAGAAPRVPPGVKNLTRSKNVGRAKASVGQGVGRAKTSSKQKRRQSKSAVGVKASAEQKRYRSRNVVRSNRVMAQTSLGANVFRRTKRKLRQGSFGGEDASPGVLSERFGGRGARCPLRRPSRREVVSLGGGACRAERTTNGFTSRWI